MRSAKNPKLDLQKRAEKHYQKKLRSKAFRVFSINFTGLSIALMTAVLAGWLNPWTILGSMLVAAISGFIIILRIFPDRKTYEERFNLMYHAVENPSIIEVSSPSKVQLLRGDTSVTLEPIFREVWISIFAPQMFSAHKETLKQIRHSSARAQQIGSREQEHRSEQMVDLSSRNAELIKNINKLEEREEQLQYAENLVIKKLTEIESSQHQLNEDRKIIEAQKTELNQLKGELITTTEEPEENSELKQKIAELEESQAALEERSAYIQTVEDQLIEQLHALTEREAEIEQKEINAGLRAD